jgi:hypothetical protein
MAMLHQSEACTKATPDRASPLMSAFARPSMTKAAKSSRRPQPRLLRRLPCWSGHNNPRNNSSNNCRKRAAPGAWSMTVLLQILHARNGSFLKQILPRRRASLYIPARIG